MDIKKKMEMGKYPVVNDSRRQAISRNLEDY